MKTTRLSLIPMAVLLTAGVGLAVPAAAQEAPEISVTTMHFAVDVGPDDATSCDVVGDLYRPADADAANPVPAILTSHGFAGSKDDQGPMARMLAGEGYAVLAYSALGFGGSTCKVTLDDPQYDGKAASRLVSFMGGQDGIAFQDADHRRPIQVPDFIALDSVDNQGAPSKHDPRIGMVGGSYGGQSQFAAAAVDPRIDTIIPMITWNNLGYSLTPNSIDQASGVTSTTPGVAKAVWSSGLALAGMMSPGKEGYAADPTRAVPCPNFTDDLCSSLAGAMVTGWPDAQATAMFDRVSVSSYTDSINIPTLLVQGQDDALFDLNEAQATYDALNERGVDVKMIWQFGGHSGPAAEGEDDYITGRIVDWFDQHLQGADINTGPKFSYFQDWAEYSGDAAPAYATASSTSVGTEVALPISNNGPSHLSTGVSGLPEMPNSDDDLPIPTYSAPGTTVNWAGDTLTAPLTVVGSPTVDVTVSGLPGGDGTLPHSIVLFAQILDIGPDGVAATIHDLVAPIRMIDTGAQIHVTMPAIVHRFEAGHRVGLSFAGGNKGFRGNNIPHQVEFTLDGSHALTLPVVPE